MGILSPSYFGGSFRPRHPVMLIAPAGAGGLAGRRIMA
jgi:hypothetical protein